MIRYLCSLVFALTLAATSVSTAVMHAEMQGAEQMVICSDSASGSGVATVTLDATGKPIAHPHRCPDCTTTTAALLPEQTALASPSALSTPAFAPPLHPAAGSSPPPQSARDPPAFA
ncbi:MAG: hypothetical protein CFE33_01700 [Pseudorhodobacter sp. PARRP1]|nr:MAG: hypothetical protein CFE33_01700 [Pseudorhodobacter sp. PARRP1]